MHLIFFDIETTGPSVEENAMVELGAVCVRIEDFTIINSFHQYLTVPEGKTWEKLCLEEFWNKSPRSRAHKALVQRQGRNPEDVMNEFVLWCQNNQVSTTDEIRFAGDAIYYDSTFVNAYLSKYTETSSLHLMFTDPKTQNPAFRPVFQTTDYFKGFMISEPTSWGSAKDCLDLLEIPKESLIYKHDHNALNDAMSMAETFCHIYNEMRDVDDVYHSTCGLRWKDYSLKVSADFIGKWLFVSTIVGTALGFPYLCHYFGYY